MNVRMDQPFMLIVMVMGRRIFFHVMLMSMMIILIMGMLVPMSNRFMNMLMPMPLPVKAYHADEHQCGSEPEKCGRGFIKQNQ